MSKRVFKTELDAVNNSLQSQVNNSISKNIVDAKGDIVTASAADTPIRLAVGTNEHRLVADSATTSGLKYVADTTNYAVGAKGDLLVGTAADTVTNLAVASTAGYLLTVDSSTSTGLKWAAGPSAGKIVQVVSASYSTAVTHNSNTYVDTGLTATITPSSTSNSIIIMTNQNMKKDATNGGNTVNLRLLRGATTLKTFNGQYYTNIQDINGAGVDLLYYDSPATTSATTYKTQFSNDQISGTITANYNGDRGDIILMEVAP